MIAKGNPMACPGHLQGLKAFAGPFINKINKQKKQNYHGA